MEIGELRQALRSGIPLKWQGKMEYESAVGRLTGIILRSGPNGEDVFSCELRTNRNSLLICRPEDLEVYRPAEK